MLDVIPKFNKFGLGFNPGQQNATPRVSGLSSHVKFSHPSAAQEGYTNAIGDDRVDGYNFEDWICPSIPGQALNNWTYVDVIQVLSAEE